jgi:hypothetical protein
LTGETVRPEAGSAELPGEGSTSISEPIIPLWRDVEPADPNDPVPHEFFKAEELPEWRLFGASRRGRSHAHAGTYREDAFEFAGIASCASKSWAIAVADGAGSCPLSRVGARIAVTAVIRSISKEGPLSDDPTTALNYHVQHALSEIRREALRRECDLHDLACTLLVLAWRPEENG